MLFIYQGKRDVDKFTFPYRLVNLWNKVFATCVIDTRVMIYKNNIIYYFQTVTIFIIAP